MTRLTLVVFGPWLHFVLGSITLHDQTDTSCFPLITVGHSLVLYFTPATLTAETEQTVTRKAEVHLEGERREKKEDNKDIESEQRNSIFS